MASNLEARLQYLETREEANTRDVIRLKTENAELLTKVCELKRENLQTAEKFVESELKFQKLESDMRAVVGFRESIDSRLTSLESNIILMQEIDDRLSSLETVMNDLRQDVTTRELSVSERLEHVTSQWEESSSEMLERLQKVESDMQAAYEYTMEQLQEEANRRHKESQRVGQSVTAKMKAVDRQIQEELDVVKSLMEVKDYISKSVVFVRLNTKHKPKTEEEMKLSKVLSTWINGGYFNGETCCLEPRVAGYYVIVVGFSQIGEGKIALILKEKDGDEEREFYLGSTFHHDDDRSFTHMRMVKAGSKLWLEMRRDKGNADLDWCYLNTWLTSPVKLRS